MQMISIRESMPFFIIQTCLELLVQSPVLLLGFFSGAPSEVAGYAIASRIAFAMSFIYAVVSRLTLPKFSELCANSEWDEVRRVFLSSVGIMSLVTFPIAMIFILFSDFILALFGEEFTRFRDTFLVLVLLQIINVVTGPAGNLLMVDGYQRLFQSLVIVGLAVSLILSWVLIPKYDSLGAGLAVLGGYGFVNVASVIASVQMLRSRNCVKVSNG